MSYVRRIGSVLSTLAAVALVANVVLAGLCCIVKPASAFGDVLDPLPVCGPSVARTDGPDHAPAVPGLAHVHCLACPAQSSGAIDEVRDESGAIEAPYRVVLFILDDLNGGHSREPVFWGISSRGPPQTA